MDKKVVAQGLVNLAKELVGGHLEAATITPKIIEKISDLTYRNNHTDSVLLLAETIGAKRVSKVLEAIDIIHRFRGDMPSDLIDLRSKILKGLLGKAKSKLSPEEYGNLVAAF